MHVQLSVHEAIKQNNYEEALKLISEASKDEVNATNELGQTPLHLAVAAKYLSDTFSNKRGDIINALVGRGADVNAQDNDGETAVYYISRWLLNNGKDKKVRCKLYHSTSNIDDYALMMTLQSLIEGEADVNIKDNKGNTALDNIMKAKWSWKDQSALSVIKTLLEAGAGIKDQKHAFRILKESIGWYEEGLKSSYRIKKDDILKMVDLVISRGITSVEKDGNEVKGEIDINYRDEEGNTPLSLAYENKKFNVIKLLIEKGADPTIVIPSTKKSFMIHVIEENLFDFVPSLKFDAVLENDLTSIRVAIDSGNYNSFLTLIKKHKANVNFSDKSGRKAIHYAAAGGNTEIVNYLLDHGANVDTLDGNGSAVLHYAVANKDGNKNIALLIQKGIDVNYRDKNGKRPIHYAIANNNFINFQTLLNNNASLEMEDFKGVKSINPFVVVITLMCNHPITKALLKDKCVKLNDVLKIRYYYDNKKNLGTILHWAAENNRFDIFETLKPCLNKKTVNQHDTKRMAPFHCAVNSNNIELVKNLLTISGIDINVLNDCGYNAIGYVKSSEMLLLLINSGIDIKSKNSKIALTKIILQFAKDGDSKSLEKLLSHKSLREVIDINSREWVGNYNNVTMLEIAA